MGARCLRSDVVPHDKPDFWSHKYALSIAGAFDLTVVSVHVKAKRHVPLNSIALAAFQELFARSSGQGRVFVNMQGEPLKGCKHWFDPALREAGISFFTWYCLRHTFASRLVMACVDLRTVAELMGHKTIQMTMRYAHLAPAHKLAAVERLAAGWRTDRPTDTRTDTSSFEQGSGGVSKAS